MDAASTNTQPVLLITGGSGSIGRAVAVLALEQGWRVALHGSSDASAKAACEELLPSSDNSGSDLIAIGCDLTVQGKADRMIEYVEKAFGKLDALVNCAVSAPPGITGPFADTDPAQYTALSHHAITQLQWLAHAALPLMTKSGGGSFITLSSDAGLFALPNQTLIGASRAAIISFCRNLALETTRQKIRVNCVSMSFVEETNIMEMLEQSGSSRVDRARQRAGLGLPRPSDVAELCLFLAGPGSQKLTGQVISLNGGLNA